MARPAKKRHIEAVPDCVQFGPRSDRSKSERIILSVDEYEAIRLIDHEGLNQAEAAKHMEVSRTTVQSIYGSARKKLARSLVEGLELCIDGGACYICT